MNKMPDALGSAAEFFHLIQHHLEHFHLNCSLSVSESQRLKCLTRKQVYRY